MRDLEKAGYKSFASQKAKRELKMDYERTTFIQSKNIPQADIQSNLKRIKEFFESKSSSSIGIRETNKQRLATLEAKGFTISDPKKFYDFVSSQQFKMMSKYIDSDQLIEDFNRASDEGFSPDQIMEQYQEFLNSEMTFEQVEERRQEATKKGRVMK